MEIQSNTSNKPTTLANGSSVKKALEWAISELENPDISERKASAQVLLAQVLGCKRLEINIHLKEVLNQEQRDKYHALVKRRKIGQPIAYIQGEKAFYDFELKVGPGVLIPRPETEEILEYLFEKSNFQFSKDKSYLDLCTGSGALAIGLARHVPGRVFALDICEKALCYCQENNLLKANSALQIIRANLLTAFKKASFDLILSNPPYLSNEEWQNCSIDVKNHEPHKALVSKDKGQEIIKTILEQIESILKPEGLFIMEGNPLHLIEQLEYLKKILKDDSFKELRLLKDYSGKDRFLIFQKV